MAVFGSAIKVGKVSETNAADGDVLTPDSTGVNGVYSWSLFMVPVPGPDVMYSGDLIIDPASMCAWFGGHLLIVSKDGVSSLSRADVSRMVSERAALDDRISFVSAVYVVPRSGREKDRYLNDRWCVSLALGALEFYDRAQGRFASRRLMWGRADLLLGSHSTENLEASMFASSVSPLVSWVALLVLAKMPGLSLDLVVSLCRTRVDWVLDSATHDGQAASWNPDSIARDDLVGALTGVFDRPDLLWDNVHVNDALWWYAYRLTVTYVQAVTGQVNVSPEWVEVDLTEDCARLCRAGSSELVGAGSGFDPGAGSDEGSGAGGEAGPDLFSPVVFASGVFEGADVSEYTRFAACPGFAPVPVDSSHLSAEQFSELSGLLVELIRCRSFVNDSDERDELNLVRDLRADFPPLVVSGRIGYFPLRTDFFDLFDSALGELDSLGTLMFARDRYREKLPGLSTLGFRSSLLSLPMVPVADLFSVSSCVQAAEVEGLVLDVEATLGSAGRVSMTSTVGLVTRSHLCSYVAGKVEDFFADPDHGVPSLRWYLSLFGIMTVHGDTGRVH